MGSVCYGFSCITVTTVMQENLLCEPHAVRGRVSCIMGAPNHNARNSIGVLACAGAEVGGQGRSPLPRSSASYRCSDKEVTAGPPRAPVRGSARWVSPSLLWAKLVRRCGLGPLPSMSHRHPGSPTLARNPLANKQQGPLARPVARAARSAGAIR